MKYRVCMLLVPAVWMAGCAVNPYQRSTSSPATVYDQSNPQPQQAAGGGSRQGERAESVAAPQDGELPVIVSLTADADSAMQQGNMLAASDAIEQALRIEPRNASLWYRLASIRLAQQQWAQVEEMAKKSISLARGDSLLRQRNWRLIAIARQQNGDQAGSRQATEKAESY